MSNPIKYHGGKAYLADWIISHMPEHTHYVEPYFGGGAVLFRKDPEGVSEVVNDKYGALMNFWQVLSDPLMFEDFERMVYICPFSKTLFERAEANMGNLNYTLARQAYWFFIRYRQSRQGLGKDFATLSRNRTRRGMNEQVSAWLSAVEGLPEAHRRLQRVVLLNEDALDVIDREDGPNTLFYLDPPYLHETRVTIDNYTEEMTYLEHEDLLNKLVDLEGKFLLSGYHSKLYDIIAERVGWNCYERKIDNKASSSKTKPKKTECLWTNFHPETGARI